MISLLQLNPYTGDVMAPSPNNDARIAPAIEGIVLHATADGGDEAHSLSWMRSPTSRVSCHLLVSRTGRVTRLVGDRQRAWHAGQSWWRGTSDVNSITLGIEIANRNDGEPYMDAQYYAVAEIVAHYCGQGLSLEDVVSHKEIAEGRKSDPHGWDWDHFRAMVQSRLRLVRDNLVVPPVREPLPSEPRLPSVPSVAPAVLPSRNEHTPPIAAPKPVLRSRTLWLNALMVLTAGGLLTGDTLDLARKLGIHLPESLTKWILFAVGLVNIILRLRTSRPVIRSPSADGSVAQTPVSSRATRALTSRVSSSAWRDGGVETFGWRSR